MPNDIKMQLDDCQTCADHVIDPNRYIFLSDDVYTFVHVALYQKTVKYLKECQGFSEIKTNIGSCGGSLSFSGPSILILVGASFMGYTLS